MTDKRLTLILRIIIIRENSYGSTSTHLDTSLVQTSKPVSDLFSKVLIFNDKTPVARLTL